MLEETMTPKGLKIFRVTRKIPKSFKGEYLRTIKNTFSEVCSKILQQPHKTTVTSNVNSRGFKTYSFSVVFGSRQMEKEVLYDIIRQLIDITLWEMTISVLADRIPSKLSILQDKYNSLYIPKMNHIKVKPNEHIKLC